jgi:hypothetical protein
MCRQQVLAERTANVRLVKNLSAVLLLVGMAIAGYALGMLVWFERSSDQQEVATSSGLTLGIGLGVAIFAVLSRHKD